MVISGSNATLLSAELATLIAGRYVTLQVFPLTLREFGDLYRQRTGGSLDDAALFRLYLRIGGLPGLLHTDLSDPVVDQMLADIVNTIAIRDVIRRHRIRDVALFEAIARFAVDPPPALPGFSGSTDLSATLSGPTWPSRVVGWRVPRHRQGFPCCVHSPLPSHRAPGAQGAQPGAAHCEHVREQRSRCHGATST